MIINNQLRWCFFLLLLIIQSAANGQQVLPCGPEKIDTAASNKAISFEKRSNKTQQVDFLVRVYFHIFSDNDGTGTAASAAQVTSEYASLQASYAADNICFLFAGIDYTNSTALNRSFNADSDPNGTALDPYQVPGCINIFYMRKINGNNTACNPPCGYGGIALGGIPGTFFLVATGNIGGGNTIGHEMGHCLGLRHTFSSSAGLENIDGSNGTTAGDLISDTKADPFAYNGNSCFNTSANGCTYTGNCQDPKGATNFAPPYTNLMSYWWAGNSVICQSNPLASAGQFTRCESFLNTNSGLQACGSPASLALAATTVSTGYYMKSAIGTVTSSAAVTINGNARATIAGGAVVISPGFRANPSSGGLTLLMLKPCN